MACWGRDDYGQATPPGGTFSQVSAGGDHTCGVRTDGTLACWGWNYYGQATPPAGTFSQVSAGYHHNCAVRTDGTLACWGHNSDGQATPPAGTIVIVKATDPAGGTGFGFTDNIAAPNSFTLDDGGTKTFSNVDAFDVGSYTVIEDDPQVTPGGFALSGLTCTDPDGGSSVDLGARKATIDLDAGETVTCTFTNNVSWIDADGDGVPDGSDLCPDTPPGEPVDSNGCSDAQVDADDDGICDPEAPSGGPSGCQLDPADNCPDTPNPAQENSVHPGTPQGDHCEDPDADTVFDITDNCPDAPNPGQTNTDVDLENSGASVTGDSLGDECDDDDDNDEFGDEVETYLGTDPLDNCPGGPPDDAWPLDINMDRFVTVVGDVYRYAGHIGAHGSPNPSPNWLQRLDINMDNYLTVVGDVYKFAGMMGKRCA